MKIWTVTTITAVLIASGASAGEHTGHQAEHPGGGKQAEAKAQTTCPVMGGKINKDLYVDHDGKRVYVCCKGCIGALHKDPEKCIKKLEDDGVTVAKIQTTCPVMGGKIDKELNVDHDGKRVYFCCPMCRKTFAEDPEKYIDKLERDGVVLDATPALSKHVSRNDEHKWHNH